MKRLRAPAALCLLLTACNESSPSTLDPSGPAAQRIERLWWILLAIASVVFVTVVALMLYSIVKRRRDSGSTDDDRWGERMIAIGGVAVPTVILAVVFFISLGDIRFLSNDPGDDALRVEVEGRLWWWEIRYPGTDAVTANEIHIPVGEPVVLELTTDDVIHSVWIPQLQAKTDMIPGRTNEMTIEADEPGTYRGQCAEFCGLQHAKMAFVVIAEQRDAFDRWLATEASSRAVPGDRQAEELYLISSCAGCHAIRGTPATSDRGPDLTHLASRVTLAAGTLTNTRDNLTRWIRDPQSIKPGADMPPAELTSDELRILVDYLEALR
ncbi:MAG: cytochrome c oxidase subunit II [Actinomycetota bacterium]|nr:cytochrome c oxidase subunit II [Actinomycetota bacterium]